MRTTLVAVAAALLAAAVPAPLSAQAGPRFGLQLSLADDAEVGLGARIEHGLSVQGAPGLRFLGSFDLFFPDDPVDYWEANANVAYQFRLRGTRIAPYAGGGLGIAHVSRGDIPESGDTELGLNLLGGVRFPTRSRMTPFLELRAEFGGGDQLVFAGGILF